MHLRHVEVRTTRSRLTAWINLLPIVLFVAAPVSAQVAADDDDILDGQRYLVRADDLVLADPAYISGSPDMTDVQYFILDTDDMMITTSGTNGAKRLTKLDCTSSSPTNHPFPQQTVVVRMFDTPDDDIVTFAPTAGATGSDCGNQSAGEMTFYVEEGISGAVHKSVASGDIRNRWLHMVPADFNGDGFDDLFITTDEWIYVATAVDTSSPSSGVHIVASHKLGSDATAMNDPSIGDFNADGNLDVAWMGTGFSSGNTPSVKFATICTGSITNTVCANTCQTNGVCSISGGACDEDADCPNTTFDIMVSGETISPDPNDGSIVTVGGKCTQNGNNQIGSELRAPPMAVAAGQFDDTAGDELAVVYLYEHDSNNNCHVMAEVYSFGQFSSSSGANSGLTATFRHNADNIATHDHISHPAAIYAEAGNLDWSSSRQHVPVVISGGTDHTVLVISFDDNLMMTLQRHEFSTDHDKTFAGLAIGRFSAAPSASTTQCTTNTDCPDTCKSDVCEISGFSCSADGDCQGTCTSDKVCSYVKPNNYDLQFAAFQMAHSSEHDSNVFVYTADPAKAFEPKQIQELTVTNFIQTATNRGVRAGSLLRAGDLQGRSQRLGAPTVVRVSQASQPDLIVGVPPMHADWLSFSALDDPADFCEPDPDDCASSFSASNLCNCTDLDANNLCIDGTDAFCLTNFSALSGTFISQYDFDETKTNQSSRTETTSWSLGLSVSLSGKTKSLTPAGLEVTQKIQFAASDTYDSSVSKTNSGYKSSGFDASSTTGFYDYLYYTTRDYNVYYYPVIGQTVCVDTCQTNGVCSISGVACADDNDCPNTATTCSDADMQQVYVQYTGAVSVSYADTDSSGKEWYQPVHEPGQVLSYPWDCDELAARNGVNICDQSSGDYSLLSEANSFSTDTSTMMYTLNWGVGDGKSHTSSKAGQFSQMLSETTTTSTPEFSTSTEGAKVSMSVAINANEAVSSSRTDSTQLGSSTGITVARAGTFLSPQKFSYTVNGYIFGQAPSKGSLDTHPTPTIPSVPETTPTTVPVQGTNGAIRSAFTVDVRSNGGSWWESGPYNNNIDVALNRPSHLLAEAGKGFSDPSVTQCRPTTLTNAVSDDCISYDPADPSPSGLWDSVFYWLRGFFITPTGSDQGPQLQTANEGDILDLQVRVYNYSLQDIPDGQILVDFYAQEWDESCNTPAGYYDHVNSCMENGLPCTDSCNECCIVDQPVDSLYIGRATLDPLPAFDSLNSDDSNWTVATVPFDTGDPSYCGNEGCGDKFFLFWVVTWWQRPDSNHPLGPELADHSLTAIPGALKSISDLCRKDTCRSSGTCAVSGTTCGSNADCEDCPCDVCIDEFSNNVGYFHQAIHIQSAATESTASTQAGGGAGVFAGKARLESVSVEPGEVLPGQKVRVRAAMRAVGGKVDGQLVRFRAVPPDARDLTIEEAFKQIRTFDEEILTYIRPERIHRAQVPFFPSKLGTYQILVSTFEDGEEKLLGTADLEVGDVVPPTPTMAMPVATPTAAHKGDDDGCAISGAVHRESRTAIAMLVLPLLFALLRRRHNLDRLM